MRIPLQSSTESEWVATCLEELGHEAVVADPNDAAMYGTRTRRRRRAAGAVPPRKVVRNPSNLTDREVEVLRLMAQGSSNREMAESLGITPKTVGHHVQHIDDKIEVSTRAAAAVFAVERQLLKSHGLSRAIG